MEAGREELGTRSLLVLGLIILLLPAGLARGEGAGLPRFSADWTHTSRVGTVRFRVRSPGGSEVSVR